MVNVPHESDDRWPQAELVLLDLLDVLHLGDLDDFLHLVDAGAFFAALFLENKAVLFADFRGNLGLDRLGQSREDLHLHEILHQLDGPQFHHRGELLDDDGRLEVDDLLVTDELDGLGRLLLGLDGLRLGGSSCRDAIGRLRFGERGHGVAGAQVTVERTLIRGRSCDFTLARALPLPFLEEVQGLGLLLVERFGFGLDRFPGVFGRADFAGGHKEDRAEWRDALPSETGNEL